MYKLMTDERIPTMITGRSLTDCWRKLARMLRVAGPRVIEATDSDGRVVRAALDGDDIILDAAGRKRPLP